MALVLVVDDDPDIRNTTRLTLEQAGHRVCLAEDGNQALHAIAHQTPDIVITDIFMPNRCGLETIAYVAKHHPEVAIIAISGGPGESSQIDLLPMARRAGAMVTLSKPFRPEHLLAAVHDLWTRPRQVVQMGAYRILERIGAGSMGVVYRAEHITLGRQVAIKLLRKGLLASPDAVTRFLREIQAVAQLSHPNIVRAYDADCIDGRYFLVMEYVTGQTLDEVLIAHGPMPIPMACDFARQTAEGLEHAHQQGLVHRDIKPRNLLLESWGGGNPAEVFDRGLRMGPRVRILDMGLARFVDTHEDTGLTQVGQILGTVDHIAPEQVEDARSVDIRADIYGLGSTLFKLLTGHAPFSGRSPADKLLRRLNEPAPLIRHFRPDVPPDLEAIVGWMLARDRDHRPAAPGIVADALRPYCVPARLRA